jgi:hypothetical protein
MRIVAALVAREGGITWCKDDGRGALDGRVIAGSADGGPVRRRRVDAGPGDAHHEGESLERARRVPRFWNRNEPPTAPSPPPLSTAVMLRSLPSHGVDDAGAAEYELVGGVEGDIACSTVDESAGAWVVGSDETILVGVGVTDSDVHAPIATTTAINVTSTPEDLRPILMRMTLRPLGRGARHALRISLRGTRRRRWSGRSGVEGGYITARSVSVRECHSTGGQSSTGATCCEGVREANPVSSEASATHRR